MGQSRGVLLFLLINRGRETKRKGGKILEKKRRAVTEREARSSRVKEQKN
jgi:hypothetical protein